MSVTVPGTVAEAGLAKGPYRAPRGTQISCKGWQQEAALEKHDTTATIKFA
jgi:urocanate hydratase